MLDAEDKQTKTTAFLEEAVKGFKIFIDTCSLLNVAAKAFWSHVIPILQREGKKVIVPFRVYEEVKKFAENPALCAKKGDPNLNQNAKAALKRIAILQKGNIVDVFGDPHDNFADNVFQTVFTRFRLKYNLMLITQDNSLAQDILAIGKSKSVQTKNRILVERICKDGCLGMFHFTPSQYVDQNISEERAQIPDDERFAFATSVRKVDGVLTVSSIPTEGSEVIVELKGERNRTQLLKALSSGGEGTIYTTNCTGIVAKIYKREKIDRAKLEKLRLMVEKNIACRGVCLPHALLYNQQQEFVGYVMQEAKGKDLQTCVFIPRLLKTTFPKWTKTDTVTLCVTILKKLKYLHDRNVILGDINPKNILVVSPTEVYFVDTDSYQIEGFPCPVGTINYTAPEIQRKDFSLFLRTLGNERFAVATLLFMIMLPGKSPYSLQGGENQIDNIINGDFAYASGSRSNKKAPEGWWRYCWSHLPRYLKDDFYETFHKDGERHAEKARYNTGDWLKKFEHYLELLQSRKLIEQDAMSADIFPTRLKKNPKDTYVRCDRRNMVYMRIRCAKCGRSFEITNGEKAFYDQKGFRLPKRCKDCRGQKIPDGDMAKFFAHIFN